MAVLLVVLMHVTVVTYTPYTDDIGSATAWSSLVNAGWPFHLTTLFVLTGMLNASAIRQGLSNVRTRRSLWTYAWLYLIWQLLFSLLRGAGLDVWTPDPWTQKKATLLQLVFPHTVLWFLLALVVWTLVLAALRRVPPAVVLSGCAALSIGSWFVPGLRGHDQYLHILQYGLYFAIGVYGATAIRSLVENHTAEFLIASGASFAVGAFIVTLPASWSMAWGAVAWYCGAAGILMGLCRLLEDVRGVTSVLQWIGKRTLPVYVTHLPIAVALTLLPFWEQLTRLGALGQATPLLAMIVTLVAALGIQAVTDRHWGHYLWSSPTQVAPRTPS